MKSSNLRFFIVLGMILHIFSFSYVFSGESAHTIKIGCDSDYPPLSLGKDGDLKGFDIDLIRQLEKSQSFVADIRPGMWAYVLNSLISGDIDAVSGILWTSDRAKVLDFSIPYLIEPYIVYFNPRSGIKSISDLMDKKLSILQGDASIESFVKPEGLDGNIQETDTYTEAFMMVEEGLADYTIAPYTLGKEMIASLGLRSVREGDRCLFNVEYRFAVQKGDSDTLFLLNEGIEKLQRDGIIQKMRKEWHFSERFTFTSKDAAPPQILIILLFLCAAGIGFLPAFVLLTMHHAKKQEILAKKNAFFETLLDSLPFPAYWKEKDMRLSGSNLMYLENGPFETDAEIQAREKRTLDTGVSTSEIKQITGPSRQEQWLRVFTVPLKNASIQSNGFFCLFDDYTQEYKVREAMQKLGTEVTGKNCQLQGLMVTDELTGLFNRSFMHQKVSEEISVYQNYKKPFSIILCYIQDLEGVNRKNGYHAGNEAIRSIGEALIRETRNVDTLGRIESASFMVILPQTGGHEAQVMAERLAHALHSPEESELFPGLRVSCGVCGYNGQDTDDFLQELENKLISIKSCAHEGRVW